MSRPSPRRASLLLVSATAAAGRLIGPRPGEPVV